MFTTIELFRSVLTMRRRTAGATLLLFTVIGLAVAQQQAAFSQQIEAASARVTDQVAELQPETDPSTTDPSTTDPSTTDPSTTDPSTTDPSTTDPDEGLIDQPSTLAAPPPAPSSSLFSEFEDSLLSQLTEISPERAATLGGGTALNIVSGSEVTVLGATDTGDLLASSIFNTGVYSRQISPIITNTRVRGYRYSQIRTTLDGAAWFPVRPDADTPLSRFDSNVVKDVAIIRGPYNVRLGPGFAFIDVTLHDTPRSECGFHLNGMTKFTWDTNGDQWYGRQAFQGGGEDYGWSVGYGHRGGIDFDAGDGLPLSASFNSRDWNFAYGYDLSDNSSLEFSYIRTEGTGIDTPGQVNDFRFLISNGFALRYELEDTDLVDRFSIRAWYNTSKFDGSAANKESDPTNPGFFFPPADPLFPARFARVQTEGETSSLGMRLLASWGDVETGTLAIGGDVTIWKQEYVETREDNGVTDFGVPPSRQDDPGVFLDGQRKLTDQLTVKAGGRIDFVDSVSNPTATVDARSLALNFGLPQQRSYILGAGYLSSDYDVNECLTLSGGVGYGESAPDLTDLYGDLPHLSIMQEGAFFVPHGELLLLKERALQADLGVTYRSERLRGGVSVFYSQVDDFITYDVPHLPPPSGPHEQHAIGVNRDARFAGGEFYGELNISDALSAFSTVSYVQGTDRDRNEPMWGVPPLDTRMGLRLLDAECQLWGIEYVFRLVDDQDRLSTVGFFGELPTPGFNTHDIRGYYKVSDSSTFVAGVENIGDAFYREHLDTRLDLTAGADTARGVVRRGVSFYFAFQSEY